MFTGLIQTTGTITNLGSRGDYRLLAIKPGSPFADIRLGESIAVDGCCLTITAFDKNSLTVEASRESLKATIISKYSLGRVVNLERALLPTDRLGGHMVTGHIDCVGEIDTYQEIGGSIVIAVRYPEKFALFLVSKGSIAMNGISLTVNAIKEDIFDVNIIPHTLKATTVASMKKGDKINLEFDIIGKYLARQIENKSREGLTMSKLIASGWNNTGWSGND
jgi:riboflavin synthase